MRLAFIVLVVKHVSMHFYHAKTLDQILQLEPLARSALSESRYSKAVFSKEKFHKRAQEAANAPRHHGVLVAEHKEQPIGCIYCALGEPLVGTGLLIASVHILFVEPHIRKTILSGKATLGLLNGLIAWTKARGGNEILIHATSGVKVEATREALTKRGFEVCGETMSYSV